MTAPNINEDAENTPKTPPIIIYGVADYKKIGSQLITSNTGRKRIITKPYKMK